MQSKQLLVKDSQYLWTFTFKHLSYLYGYKENLMVTIELNFSEKAILCSVDMVAKYDAVLARYATRIGDLYAGTARFHIPW